MNRCRQAFLLLTVSILFVQCAPKTTTKATPKMTDEEIVASVKKQYTEAQLDEGKALYQSSCKKCHSLFAAESRSIAKWERVLPRMSKRAKLEAADAGKVRAYLIANAKHS